MPPELGSFLLWCVARGEVDREGHRYTGDRGVWRAARAQWLAERGLPADVWPPDELTCYEVWCANRGLAPLGVADDVVSLRAASAQWVQWEAEREVWAAAHGRGAGDAVLDMVDEDEGAPFDPDCI